MRLKRLSPTLPPDLQPLIPILDAAGLKATDQVVHTPRSTVFRLLPRPVGPSFTKNAYGRLLERCLEVEMGGSRPILSSEIDSSSTMVKLAPTFGLESLDDLLVEFLRPESGDDGTIWNLGDHEGFKGGILEVAGTKSSGRTLLTLHLILTTLIQNPSSTCLWVDTEASFDPDRTRSILDYIFRKNRGASPVDVAQDSRVTEDVQENDEREKQAEEILKRLELVNVFDLDGAKSSLEASFMVDDSTKDVQVDTDMGEELEGGNADRQPDRASARKMIVIDSIGSILGPCLSTGDSHGRAKMQAFLDGLSTVVHRNRILLVMINSTTPLTGPRTVNPHPSIFSTTTVKPSLGIGFTYSADVTLLLQTTSEVFESDPKENNGRGGTGRTVVEVLKNRMGATSTWTVFQTDGINIRDVSP